MTTPTVPLRTTAEISENERRILTPGALEFLNKLHLTFNKRRLQLLETREERREQIYHGTPLTFLPDTASIRNDPTWKVASIPSDLQCRWVEITGPTDSKMMINALNSGADVYMADFEDSSVPTWKNLIEGQLNLSEAVKGTLHYTSPEGREYHLNKQLATLLVRPRGWHLDEKHYLVEGTPISGSLFDFGLAFYHNAHELIKKGSGPYFYLPKLESHLEARLWNDVFNFAQDELKIPQGTIRATVLIETIFAAFEMHEILFELRQHICGLNAGRWDYLFSIIKTFAENKTLIFPNRSQITMTVPFMKAYTQLLIETCQQRNGQPMGGMSAFIPDRKDTKLNARALSKVEEDKLREVKEGFVGTWVAHPDLVSVARRIFEKAQQQNHPQNKTTPNTENLLDFSIPDGTITAIGLKQNIAVAIHYLAAWLGGTGAVAIFHLMEDAATAEISRSQLWQWIHHEAKLDDGTPITFGLYHSIADGEVELLKAAMPQHSSNIDKARVLLDELVQNEPIDPFFTTLAYSQLT